MYSITTTTVVKTGVIHKGLIINEMPLLHYISFIEISVIPKVMEVVEERTGGI